ncbi:MAG: 50S ribosomal protein L23 [Burkholderiales bacterium]
MKFSEERLLSVIVSPLVSEKTTFVGDKNNQSVFEVRRDATKPEIKAAVELLFKVKVEGVTTANAKGKSKRFGRMMGRRNHSKKAYVSLAKGQEINFAGEGV